MKVLLFTHKNDIDGIGNVVLAKKAFKEVDYVLCGTFDLTRSVLSYYNNGSIYDYDQIFITDLCLEEPVLSMIANDEKLNKRILNLDHHRTFATLEYTKHPFIKVIISNDRGLCSGTSLFYQYLLERGLIDKKDKVIEEFVELTRQHDTWEWKNIYNNNKARELATLFDAIGCYGYIDLMMEKLSSKSNNFEFNTLEKNLINNRLIQIEEKLKAYSEKVIYKEILGLRAGIVFITYEYRNELAEYFKQNNFDMDFAMMIALDPGVVCYRSVKENVEVRKVAEHFGGKGHSKAGSNPISENKIIEILEIITKNKEV